MSEKPTYEELENRIQELEKESAKLKKGEEILYQEKILADGIIDSLPGLFYMFDDERFVRWNKKWEKITGYLPEELGNMYAYDFFESANKEYIADRMQIAFREGGSTAEAELITKDGRKIPYFFSGLRVVLNGKPYLMGMGIDITELKQAEKALRESEERFHNVYDTAPLAFVLWDKNTRVIDWNKKAEEVFGWLKDEIINRNFFDFIIPENNRPLVEDVVNSLINGDLLNYSINENLTKEGKIITCEWNNSALHDDNGNIIGAISLGLDITERKQAEEALQESEKRLQQAQKMESIGTLAGGIAHDFNNILFPVVGYTEMLLEDAPEDSPLRHKLGGIYSGALRASDLVKQILAFSRQDRTEIKLIEIQPVIKEALKLIRSTIPTSIEIKQYIKKDCGAIKADPTQIHQIVMNLATNAYHAMEDADGELKVSLKEIELGEQDVLHPDMEPGTYACLTVADTGVGMDKDLTGRIFDPFFTTKEEGKGTGMGLSIIHGIVKSAGGSVHVYSEPGKGTEFHVYLPIVKSAFEQQVIQTVDTNQGGTERILLVDDEEAIVSMEKQLLERLGYQVVSRTSSLEALEAFRAAPDKFDMVITDMSMPNMSGDRLASELVKIRPDIPILLCTGFSERMSEEKAAAMGIKNFLMKPIIRKDLSKKIRDVLDNK